MVQNDTTPPATEVSNSSAGTQTLGNPLQLIEQAYPHRSGFVRRIHPVFKSYYRVNYHELDNSFMVKDSYFLNVTDRVETMN